MQKQQHHGLGNWISYNLLQIQGQPVARTCLTVTVLVSKNPNTPAKARVDLKKETIL